ncbi:MAG: hypothetical protein LAT68_12280 [Cyclobacteriaceae bacterium]|nr:hypothetical protein [Cyclobacteriaceae bacterium]MCH8517095.1 hypothetical protein [Cyclobacteriaceae bacterium]
MKFSHQLLFLVALVCLSILIKFSFINRGQEKDSFIKKIGTNLQQVYTKALLVEQGLLTQLQNNSVGISSDIESESIHLIYRNNQLIYWTNSFLIPTNNIIDEAESIDLINFKNVSALLSKQSYSQANDSLVSVILIPLKTDETTLSIFSGERYSANVFGHYDFNISAQKPDESNAIYMNDGSFAFNIYFGKTYHHYSQQAISLYILLVFLIIGMLIYMALYWSRILLENKSPFLSIFLLGLVLIAVRLLMLVYDFPSSVKELDLFDSRYFASSYISPSLGDYLINSLFLFAFVIFFYSKRNQWISMLSLNDWRSKVLVSSMLLFSLLLLGFQVKFITDIFQNSVWTLEVTQEIRFDLSYTISLLIFIINWITYFFGAHLCLIVITNYYFSNPFLNYLIYAASAIFGLIILLLLDLSNLSIVVVHTAYLLISFILGGNNYFERVSYKSLTYLIVSSVILALYGSVLVYILERESRIEVKKSLANYFLEEQDVLAEFYLSQAVEKIKSDADIKKVFNDRAYNEKAIEKAIKRKYLKSYLEKYDIIVHFFNPDGSSISLRNSRLNYFDIRKQYNKSQYMTEYENLYFVKNTENPFDKRYFKFIDLNRGYLLLDLKLRRPIPNTISSFLMLDEQKRYFRNNQNLKYALLNMDEIIVKSDNFNFSSPYALQVLNPAKKDNGFVKSKHLHKSVEIKPFQYLLMSIPHDPLRIIIGNFCYNFTLLIIIISLASLIYGLLQIRGTSTLSFSAKIQLYLNLAFFIPLFFVSAISIQLIYMDYLYESEAKQKEKTQRLSKALVNESGLMGTSTYEQQSLKEKVASLSKILNSDIKVYNKDGRLLTTNDIRLMDYSLVDDYLNPRLFFAKENLMREPQVVQENIGKFEFSNVYYPIRSDLNKEVIGFAAIPYYDSRANLREKMAETVTTILNTFTLVFILFIIISYYASRVLTYPINFLTEQIKQISNEEDLRPLTWKTQDEIGLLASEYNKLMLKFQASRDALMRNEKEEAWREMAKQVAHEIKNPLTPMKLSLQHLIRMSKDNTYEKNKYSLMVQKTADNLLNQIENLNDIATSFSSFAKMPSSVPVETNLSNIINSTIGIFQSEQDQRVVAELHTQKAIVYVDDKLMSRIISNILINGIQSVPEDRDPELSIVLWEEGEEYLMKISDNGSGIPEDYRDKVFVPDFSTKYAGSGIGLALAKRGINDFGGRIWFETMENEGTDFYISLPKLTLGRR